MVFFRAASHSEPTEAQKNPEQISFFKFKLVTSVTISGKTTLSRIRALNEFKILFSM